MILSVKRKKFSGALAMKFLFGKGGGVGVKKGDEVGGDFGANFADVFFGRVFVDFKFCQRDVVVQGDDRAVAGILILNGGQFVERLFGTRQIEDPDVEKKFGAWSGAAQESAANAILRIDFGEDAAN